LTLVISQRQTAYERFLSEWQKADGQLQSNLWELARISASLTTTYGESDVAIFASEVKRSPQYIYQLAQTFQAFPEDSTRVENLPFSTHKIAARHKEPKIAIGTASEKKLSGRQLEVWIDERAAEEKKSLKRRDADKRENWGRGRTSDQWEGLEAKFLSLSDEQLVFYALSICSRVARSLHLETVEHVLSCDDVPHYTEERKHQLKFKDVT
jgi:hypothetical protein